MPAQQTNIAWADWTLNAWKGCAKISEGCKHCYAAELADRFDRTPEPWTIANVEANVIAYEESPQESFATLPADGRWVFVPSSSDPYLPWVPDEVHAKWLDAIHEYDQHTYQILTKHGVEDHGREIDDWPDHVMLGVSVESSRRAYRLDWLREQQAATKFVSFEPLVECIPGTDLDLSGIDWAIIGGESLQDSDRRRDMDPAWARNLVRACRRQDVAVFFKQHSGPFPEGKILLDMQDGQGPRGIRELPEVTGTDKHDPYRALQCPNCGQGFVHEQDGHRDVPQEPGLCSDCIAEIGVEPDGGGQTTLSGGEFA